MLKSTVTLVAMATLFLSGCVTGTRSVDIAYTPTEAPSASKGSIYIKDIEDKRQFEQRPKSPSTPSVSGELSEQSPETLASFVGRQRNGYGLALGSVTLPEGGTVQQEMREVLTAGLQRSGYAVVDENSADMTVDVDIKKFWAWFSPGFWSVSFSGIVETALSFANGNESTDILVTGEGLNRGQVASNANWALAYSRTFDNYVENLATALGNAGL